MVYFPLSTSSDIISLQDIMHIVVTALVVLLTVIALVLLVISFYILKLKKNMFLFFVSCSDYNSKCRSNKSCSSSLFWPS
jgi:hypothetical protein